MEPPPTHPLPRQPRLPTPSDLPLVGTIVAPHASAINCLILLHGLGGSHLPFAQLAKNLNLPDTVCISLRGLYPVPTHETQPTQPMQPTQLTPGTGPPTSHSTKTRLSPATPTSSPPSTPSKPSATPSPPLPPTAAAFTPEPSSSWAWARAHSSRCCSRWPAAPAAPAPPTAHWAAS
ncbi:hypothetical protein PORY_001114 [Pneumocystis oryctolagi]|uniref:Uncharacterized protein n=1 Tax=Pneumocystis oryctolagi TaxID=42067 RepID=A0ACB7CF48_9ASCO|nr:hypothetical protein PORY_001114 [Pneumocystis oryctolagi]